MYKSLIKRLFDLIFAFLLLVFLLPISLILIILIILDSEGSAFYTQERIGYKGKSFWIIKLRTMKSNSEKSGSGLFTYKSDPRITRIGKILRNYSLDEFPQLINILKGDMSFVGPRPPVPYHPYRYENYPNEYKLRFDLKPGITGLAQISGRTNLIQR
jgi:undecaprenyl phosphate N,N'-diacetylbacillosamine 1-phosphate transferase